MAQKLTTEIVVARFKEINGDKYDYSEFEYINAKTKGKIICPKHGEFWQSSNVHLKGVQCPKCAKENIKRECFRLTKEVFFRKSEEHHGNKYEYDLTNFENSNSIIRIKCPIHGWFEQHVIRHMHGQGCPQCGHDAKREKMTIPQDEIIERFRKLHGDKYDYSKFKYKNCWTKSIIICPVHGEFEQSSNMHLIGHGCPKCAGRGKSKEDFVKEAIAVHGEKYDYSLVNYTTAETKVEIKCNKCGTTFWQKPWVHLRNHGCPHCNFSKGEMFLENVFKKNNIEFIPQKKFEWLGKQSLDFYLPQYNIGIEYQGKQHFGQGGWGDNFNFAEAFERDLNKIKLCEEHNVKLLHFTNINVPSDFIEYPIYDDISELIEVIMNSN